MTEEQSATNAARNLVMAACEHDPFRTMHGGIVCSKCGGTFALIHLPVLLRMPEYDWSDEDDE